jgi:predicted O-methyltransferase YrrM
VVNGKDPAGYEKIKEIYRELRHDTSVLQITDLGAGSVPGSEYIRKTARFVRSSSINAKYGRFLSRLVNQVNPSIIIELGTGAGFSTMFMAIAGDKSRIYSIEGCPEIAALAGRNVKSLGLKNTEIITGSFRQALPDILKKVQYPLMIFIDGDHRGENLLGYFQTILPVATENTVLVLDDIRWSGSMYKAWEEIIRRTEVSVSIDMFRLGILFLKKDIKKQHFIVKF